MKKVLIVDDEKLMRDSLTEFLKNELYLVVTAASGTEALSYLKSNNVDLMITDIIMPEMEGLELIKLTKKSFPKIPIFAMSGNVIGTNYLEAACILGANEMLRKPFNLSNLKALIAQYIQD